jgi:methylated-DNA-protein-cysteine methyltransferase-like protein
MKYNTTPSYSSCRVDTLKPSLPNQASQKQANTESIRHIVLQQLSCIPKGKVCTYGDLAKLAGYPSHARFVGSVLRNLPKDTQLPWHRVINGQGRISFLLDSITYNEQRSRLEDEEIIILNGRIDLKTYRIKL